MTPHSITVIIDNNTKIEIPASGKTIRLQETTVQAGDINGIPLSKTVFGDPVGMPERKPDVFYIVSQLVKAAFPERDDLLVPAEIVRDENGIIIGCRSLGL